MPMKDPKSLQAFRKEIDKIDDDIIRLLNARARHVIEIGKLKKAQDSQANLHTPAREAEILDRLCKNNPGPFPTDGLRAVYREIMSGSLALEGPLQVAYLGPSATFTHLACIQKFGSSAQYVPLTSIKDVFNEVERGRSDFGVVPIENSTEGVVNHTLDMFIDSNLLIYGEVQQEVSHHLLSKADSLGGIKKIYSHPHAIAQCRNWLETNLPGVPVSEVHSTARAAEIAAEDPTTAAIASELAGQIYGLKVLKARIEDNIGALYELLRPFASSGVNLTKIESRPSRRKAWEYIFFIDCEGHMDEDRVKKALTELRSRCLFLKILGSYPTHS